MPQRVDFDNRVHPSLRHRARHYPPILPIPPVSRGLAMSRGVTHQLARRFAKRRYDTPERIRRQPTCPERNARR